MWEWKPTRPEDLARIEVHEHRDWHIRRRAEWDLEAPEVVHALETRCRTWWNGDSPVAMIGMQERWTGVAEVFTLLSKEALDRPVALSRGVLDWLEQSAVHFGLWRVQATARADRPKAQRFLVWLGFEREGTLRRYGPDGADHLLYARLWNHG